MELFSFARVDTWLFFAAAAAWIFHARVVVELRTHLRRQHLATYERNGFSLAPSRLYGYFLFSERYRELNDGFLAQRVFQARAALAAFALLILLQLLPGDFLR